MKCILECGRETRHGICDSDGCLDRADKLLAMYRLPRSKLLRVAGVLQGAVWEERAEIRVLHRMLLIMTKRGECYRCPAFCFLNETVPGHPWCDGSTENESDCRATKLARLRWEAQQETLSKP